MHIAEGVLSAPVLGAGAAVTAVGLAVGLKKMDYDRLPQVAILAAGFFVASLVHVPIGPTSSHLILNGLVGLILGWAAFPAIFVGVALQALLFQYGGLTTLGVNTASMALPGVLAGLLFRRAVVSGPGWGRAAGSFAAGFCAVLGAGIIVAGALAASGDEFLGAARLVLLAHIPVMVVEGLITAVVVGFLARVRPAMLGAGGAR